MLKALLLSRHIHTCTQPKHYILSRRLSFVLNKTILFFFSSSSSCASLHLFIVPFKVLDYNIQFEISLLDGDKRRREKSFDQCTREREQMASRIFLMK